MKGLAGIWALATLVALTGFAVPAAAAQSSPEWALSELRALAADGVIDGYPRGQLSRTQIAVLTARALARVEVTGVSKADENRVQTLSNEFRGELDALGVRDPNLAQARTTLDRRTRAAQRLGLSGDFMAGTDRALRATVNLAIAGSSHLNHLVLQAGTLDSLPDSVAGLALSHHTLQPSLRGVSLQGTANGVSDFYFSISRMDRNLYYVEPVALASAGAGSFSFPVSPQAGGYLEFGTRDLISGRLLQHVRSGGATIGLTYNHVFGSGSNNAGDLVSNTVFGMDVSVPLLARSGWRPAVYAEAATSTATSSNVLYAPSTRLDNALVAGVRFHVRAISGSVQYQAVGPNFVNGAQSPAGFFGFNPVSKVASAPQFNSPTFNPFEDTTPGSLSAYIPNTQGLKIDLTTPVKLGAYSVQGNFGAAHLQELSANAFGSTTTTRGTDDRFSAGTSFGVRALGRPVAVDVSASYEHLLRNDSTASAYVPLDPGTQGPDPGAFVSAPAGMSPSTFNPNFIDVTRRSLNAAAAVPLSQNLRLNLQYNTQYYTGSYSGLTQAIDGRKDFYLGNLTYHIPSTSSAITFSAKQYRYRDSLLPTNGLTQNRADLNFTVRF